MYNNWASDDKVTKFLRWNSHKNVEESFKIFEMWENESKDRNNYQWAIDLKETNQVIGSIDLVDIDEETLRGEVDYAIGYNFFG